MERCPNCGTPARPGAKFCTTCGARFAESDETTSVLPETEAPRTETPASESEPESSAETSDWPASPGDNGAATPSGWGAPRPDAESPEPGQSDEIVDVVASTWGTIAPATWPTPPEPATETGVEPTLASSFAPPRDREANETASPDVGERESTARRARAEANELLDRLRETIARLGGAEDHELEDVIAELEVAVTPPGAIAPDAVAELREALLTARERPRDVDTMVDLSRRLDAIVALAFAYDRAVAAIERALEILRER